MAKSQKHHADQKRSEKRTYAFTLEQAELIYYMESEDWLLEGLVGGIVWERAQGNLLSVNIFYLVCSVGYMGMCMCQCSSFMTCACHFT